MRDLSNEETLILNNFYNFGIVKSFCKTVAFIYAKHRYREIITAAEIIKILEHNKKYSGKILT